MSAVQSPSHVRWVREWRTPGRMAFRVGRSRGGHVAEWEGLGTLWVSSDGQEAIVTPLEGLDPRDEAKWRHGAVVACLRHLSGRPTLHASAVTLNGRAFLFLGDSGAGKSTFAASLCAYCDTELLADDLASIDLLPPPARVAPHEGSHWLIADSAAALGHAPVAGTKGPVPAARPAVIAAPLAAMFVLAFGDSEDVSATSVRGHAAFAAVNEAFVRLVVDDPTVHLRDLDAIALIVASAPMVTLARPRSLKALGAVARSFPALASRVVSSPASAGD